MKVSTVVMAFLAGVGVNQVFGTCPEEILSPGNSSPITRKGGVTGPVSRRGWGILGRRYSVPATIIQQGIPVQHGTMDRFTPSHALPGALSGTLTGFGLILGKAYQDAGMNGVALAAEYFLDLPFTIPGLAAITTHALVQWGRMSAKICFKPHATDKAKSSPRALAVSGLYETALKKLLSSKVHLKNIFHEGGVYLPYHLVAYAEPDGAVRRLTLLAVLASDPGSRTEIDLLVALNLNSPRP